jgi:uncharacterized SAM-binding protein YcdF (DUF218 family)
MFWLFILVTFAILFFVRRSWFINVYVLGFILFMAAMVVLTNTFFADYSNENIRYFALSAFIFAFIPGILLLLSILSFFSSKILMEKEGRKVRNLFISLIGFGSLIALIASVTIFLKQGVPVSIEIFYIYFMGLFFYYMWLFTSLALYTWLYNVFPPMKKPDYIIMLGSGLIGDRVPPLLASRLDKGVKLYKKWNEQPLLLTSGGKGNDETVAEAIAMKKYIVEKYGISPDQIIAEDQSTTTEENLRFSKILIDERIEQAQGVFVTNNFHVYRASIYAKREGLKATGVGSRTAFYYVPNAFVREFIGLLEMTKWWHILVMVLYTALCALLLRGYM